MIINSVLMTYALVLNIRKQHTVAYFEDYQLCEIARRKMISSNLHICIRIAHDRDKENEQ